MLLHFHRKALAVLALTGFLSAVVSGCGEGVPSFNLTPVTGTVKVNGAPLADADVQFVFDGTPPEKFYGSVGKTDPSGKYELITNKGKGTIPGKFKILVSKITDKNGNQITVSTDSGIDLQQMLMSGDAIESIPAAYSSIAETTLSAEVVEGQPLVKDIDITK